MQGAAEDRAHIRLRPRTVAHDALPDPQSGHICTNRCHFAGKLDAADERRTLQCDLLIQDLASIEAGGLNAHQHAIWRNRRRLDIAYLQTTAAGTRYDKSRAHDRSPHRLMVARSIFRGSRP